MTATKLTADARRDAIADFVDYRYPNGAPEGYLEGCTVLYNDLGQYQVVDASGHGDGTGDWHEVG